MAAERAGRGKLTEFVANHILCDKNLQMLLSIMNHERETDKLRDDRAGTSPRLDGVAPSR